jgi:hypothetical protein
MDSFFEEKIIPIMTEEEKEMLWKRALTARNLLWFISMNKYKPDNLDINVESFRKRINDPSVFVEVEMLQRELLEWLLSLESIEYMKVLLPYISCYYITRSAVDEYMRLHQYEKFKIIVEYAKVDHYNYIEQNKYFNSDHLLYALLQNDIVTAQRIVSLDDIKSIPGTFAILNVNSNTKQWINSHISRCTIQ